MPSFWDLVPASLLPTQPFIPPDEQARALAALAQSGGIAPTTALSAVRPDTNFAGTDTSMRAGSRDANAGANSWVLAGARRPTSFWDLLPPPTPGQPFGPVLPRPGELGPGRAAAPATPNAPLSPPAAPAGGLRANLLAIGAAGMRPFTDYFPTQGQYAREGIDLIKQGWRDITSPPVEAITPETVMGVGPVPMTPEAVRGVGEIGLGAINYLGSPINAWLHTFIGQPAEDLTGIPSKYTDFAAGLALPFVKRVPGLSAPPRGVPPPVPRVARSAAANAPRYTPEQASPPRATRPLTAEEDNRSLLYDKARDMLQQIDPDNVKLTLNSADEIPSLQDIHTLTDEISVLREQNQLWDIHQHHPFLKGKKFASKFKAVGIDPEDYITYMWARDHSALDIGPNNWTSQWRKFLNQHPEANSDMMHRQLNTMLRRPEEQ